MTKLPSLIGTLRLLFFSASLLFIFNSANAQCTNTSSYGSATLTTTTGASATISCNYATEYGTWSGVTAGYGYTTSSTVSGDYITIRSSTSSGTVVAHGLAPLTWVAQTTATHYIHINTDAACGTASSCRNITTTVLGTGCLNTSSYGTGTLSSSVTSATINCNYASEYGTWNGIVSGNNYTTGSSVTTDFITIRSGSSSGPIVAFGIVPVTWNALTTATHYIHVNTDTACGTQSSCRNITTTFNAQCPAPNTLTELNIGTTFFTLAFNEVGSATQWQVELDSGGTGNTSYLVITNDTVTGTGFAPSTAYTWRVRAICGVGDTSIWSTSSTFNTLCNTFTAPYTENFDGLALTSPYTALPTCWGTQTGPDYWDVTNDVVNNGHAYLPNIGDHTTGSANYMWIDASSDITANAMETPLIDVSNLTVREAGFWFASNNTANSTNHTIALDAWDGSAWVNVATEAGNFTSWVEVSGILPSTIPDTTKFRIYAIAATGTTGSTYFQNDLGVDDFFVIEGPSCPEPITLTANSITSTGATLGWTEVGSATAWQVEYGPDGFTQGSTAGSLMSSSADSLTVSALSPISNYQFYVRSVCGAADSSMWVGPMNFTTNCTGTLSGVYTLDSASPITVSNYQTMESFIQHLNICGLGGAVTLNVVANSGPYVGPWDFGAIPGSSATNTVTINGNGNVVNKNASDNHFVRFDGTEYFTINDFEFINQTPSTAMFGVQMLGASNHISITNNTIDIGTGYTSSLSACIALSNSTTSATSYGDNASNVTISGNELIGGYYSVVLNGTNTTTPTQGHTISNNEFKEFYYYGLRLYYVDSIIVDGNEFSRPTRTAISNFYSLYAFYLTNGKVMNNRFHSNGANSSTAYPIYISNSNNSAGSETEIINNAIYNLQSTGTIYGIYLLGTRDYMNIYHNTVEIGASGTGTRRGIFLSGAPNNHNIKNNIVSISGQGTGTATGIYSSSTSTTFVTDNNDVYVNASGTNYFGYYSGNRADLSAWQTGTVQGANSAEDDPIFANVAAGDVTPLSQSIDDMGALVGALTDIDGNTRSTSTPDVGAIEFVGIPGDLEMTDAALAQVSDCYGSADTAFAQVTNVFGSIVDFSINHCLECYRTG
jgi:hypothetical protein